MYKNDGSVDHFTVNAIVDGVKTTVSLANGAEVETFTGGVGSTETLSTANNPIKDHTLYVIDSYDKNGYVDEMSEAVSSANGAGTYYWVGLVGSQAAKNNIVILNGVSYAYASDAVVYTISATGDVVTVGDISSLTTDGNDKISVVVAGSDYGTADNNTIKEIYVYQQDAGVIGGGGTVSNEIASITFTNGTTGKGTLTVTMKDAVVSGTSIMADYQLQRSADNGVTWFNIGTVDADNTIITGDGSATSGTDTDATFTTGAYLYRLVVTVSSVTGGTETVLAQDYITNAIEGL